MEFKPFKIGKYEFVEILGRGGMGEVYRVRLKGEQGFEKEFAIKRILQVHLADPEVSQRFEAEAKLTSILNHANIVHVFEFIKSGGDYFLVMEYIDGKNLGSLREDLQKKNSPVPLEIALYIVNEVCKGLDYAHNKVDPKTGARLNIIHRDVSPQNVMMSYEGSVKIVDFGIAKVVFDEGDKHTGRIAGKLSYMSPEQAWGRPVDSRSDVFSLTAILFELLTNKKLFDQKGDAERLRAVQDCLLPNLDKDLSVLAPALAAIIKKGLSPIADLRFLSASEMRMPLQRFLNEHYPKMDQSTFAAWLNKNVDLRSSVKKPAPVEMTPLVVNEQQWLDDGFSRLNIKPSESSENTMVPPPRHSERSGRFLAIGALGTIATILILLGIWFKFQIKTEPSFEVVQTPAEKLIVDRVPAATAEALPSPIALATTPSPIPVAKTEVEVIRLAPAPVQTPVVAEDPQTEILAKPIEDPAIPPKVLVKKQVKLIPKKVVPPPVISITLPSSTLSEEDKAAQKEFERLAASVETARPKTSGESAKKLFELGMADFEQKRYVEALKFFHKSRQLKPSYLPAWVYEVMSLEALGRHVEAKEVATTILRLQPETKKFPVIMKYLKP